MLVISNVAQCNSKGSSCKNNVNNDFNSMKNV